MASRSIELEPAEEIAVQALGEPGQRRFFLVARGAAETVLLGCEKFHVEGLLTRAKQLLEAHGLPSAPAPEAGFPEPAGADVEWQIAELGLGYHESRQQFVIVARELAEGETEPATARFWAGSDAIRKFLKQAADVLAQGRATCPRCGLPIDPSGHPCPALNGSRPVF